MRQRRAETQVFSVSFLDVLSCALGGVLILLLVAANQPKPKEGFVLPVTLVFRIDWDKDVDIDLRIRDPDTAQASGHENGFVSYENLRSKIGSLMRDARSEQPQQWEAYFTNDTHPGVYEIYAHYYADDHGPVSVTLRAVLFAGDVEREQSIEMEQPITLSKGSDGTKPGRLLGRFELVQVGSGFELRKIN